MAEVAEYTFSFKEVVEALIKQQGLREGLWSLRVDFGLSAANIHRGEGSKEFNPAAIVPIVKLGLQRGQEDNNLTVDAAKVKHPRPSTRKHAQDKGKTNQESVK